MIIEFKPTDKVIRNPDRGFLRFQDTEKTSTDPPLKLDPRVLRAYYADGYTLSHLVCYFDRYDRNSSQPITRTQMDRILNHLSVTKSAGMKCIVRFAFIDHFPNGEKGPFNDYDMPVIEKHLAQLKSELFSNPAADAIAVVQAGFIGTFGEWYYTDHFARKAALGTSELNEADLRKRRMLLDRLLEVVPSDLMIQMRYVPERYRFFGTELTAVGQSKPQARIGLHNDAFLNSWDDAGTFAGDTLKTNQQYFDYASNEARFVVVGGEMNDAEKDENGNCPDRSVKAARAQLSKLRYSFFNWDYHTSTIQGWGDSFVDEMKQKLGYRLVLVRADLPQVVGVGKMISGSIRIRNDGWAALYNSKTVHLILERPGFTEEVPLPFDLRELLPTPSGNQKDFAFNVAVPSSLPPGEYSMHLQIRDSKLEGTEFCILTANEHTWDSASGMNSLLHTVAIK